MRDIDWSLEFDATHHDKQGLTFYKKVEGVWMWHMGNNEWWPSESFSNGEITEQDLIAR
jgi:hypothetical protein